MNHTTTAATCDFIHSDGPSPEGTHHLYGSDQRFFIACAMHAHRHGMVFPRVRELATGIDITTESVHTGQLRRGDVVYFADFARLVIDRDIQTVPGREGIHLTSARIDNWDHLTEMARLYPQSGAALVVDQAGPEHRWSIRGGHATFWEREIRTRN